MAKWVTFHWHIITGITHYQEHKNREEAAEYFKRHYRSYFELAGRFRVKPPCSYGYPHRKYICMSLAKFRKDLWNGGGEKNGRNKSRDFQRGGDNG